MTCTISCLITRLCCWLPMKLHKCSLVRPMVVFFEDEMFHKRNWYLNVFYTRRKDRFTEEFLHLWCFYVPIWKLPQSNEVNTHRTLVPYWYITLVPYITVFLCSPPICHEVNTINPSSLEQPTWPRTLSSNLWVSNAVCQRQQGWRKNPSSHSY